MEEDYACQLLINYDLKQYEIHRFEYYKSKNFTA